MKLTIQHVNVRSTDSLDSLIENQIIGFQSSLQIDEAKVRLAYCHELSPAYRVDVHLVTPGPDVVAQAHEHTMKAAILKVMGDLEQRIGEKSTKRLRKLRSNIQGPLGSRLFHGATD
jgi:ribosomal subunit interface protein